MEKCFPKLPTRTPVRQVLAVMIPGGPYVEDVERRLRSRRAVIEGLETTGYGPRKTIRSRTFAFRGPILIPISQLAFPRFRRIETKMRGAGSHPASVQLGARR